MKIRKAIIPAAGKGLRMEPLTKITHKELLPLLNRTAFDYLFDEIENSDIEEVFIVINKTKEDIKNYVLSNDRLIQRFRINFIYQEKQRGLGDAIYQVKEFIDLNEFFLVLLPDNFIMTSDNSSLSNSLINIHYSDECSVISVELVSPDEIHLRGSLKFSKTQEASMLYIEQILEKSSINFPSLYTIAGRYILNYSIFNYIDNKKNLIDGEIELTTAINKYLKYHKLIGYIFNGHRYDMGSIDGYAKAFTSVCLNTLSINKTYMSWLENELQRDIFKK